MVCPPWWALRIPLVLFSLDKFFKKEKGKEKRKKERKKTDERKKMANVHTRIVQAGGEWEVQVLVDPQRELYHAWGLGLSTTWYAVNPLTLWHTWKLGTEEGIWYVRLASCPVHLTSALPFCASPSLSGRTGSRG